MWFSCLAVLTLSSAQKTYQNPIVPGNHPDPGAIYVNGTFYLATTNYPMEIFSSSDLSQWTKSGVVFQDKPSWAATDFWAPEIHAVKESFVAYYTARDHNGQLCIGAATGTSVTGPFTDIGHPIAKDDDPQWMYIDSTYFYDSVSDKHYLVWKRGTVTPPEETDTLLFIQELSQDGLQVVGDRHIILRNNLSSWEFGVVEAPWIIRPSGQSYFYLFYSGAHCCDGSGSYAVGVARARNVTGPYEKAPSNPILHSNTIFAGPGHCAVLPVPGDSSQWVIFYHSFIRPDVNDVRALLQDMLYINEDGWPQLVTNTSSPSIERMPVPPFAAENREVLLV